MKLVPIGQTYYEGMSDAAGRELLAILHSGLRSSSSSSAPAAHNPAANQRQQHSSCYPYQSFNCHHHHHHQYQHQQQQQQHQNYYNFVYHNDVLPPMQVLPPPPQQRHFNRTHLATTMIPSRFPQIRNRYHYYGGGGGGGVGGDNRGGGGGPPRQKPTQPVFFAVRTDPYKKQKQQQKQQQQQQQQHQKNQSPGPTKGGNKKIDVNDNEIRYRYNREMLLELRESAESKKMPKGLEKILEENFILKANHYYNAHYYDPWYGRCLGPTQVWDSESQQWVLVGSICRPN